MEKNVKKNTAMAKVQCLAGVILAFSVIAAVLITSFEIAMYSDFSVYQNRIFLMSRTAFTWQR